MMGLNSIIGSPANFSDHRKHSNLSLTSIPPRTGSRAAGVTWTPLRSQRSLNQLAIDLTNPKKDPARSQDANLTGIQEDQKDRSVYTKKETPRSPFTNFKCSATCVSLLKAFVEGMR